MALCSSNGLLSTYAGPGLAKQESGVYKCLQQFRRRVGETHRDDCVALKEHRESCVYKSNWAPSIYRYPKGEKAKLKFTKYGNQLPSPFVLYANMESILKSVPNVRAAPVGVLDPSGNLNPASPTPNTETAPCAGAVPRRAGSATAWCDEPAADPLMSGTEKYQTHLAASFFTHVVSPYPEVLKKLKHQCSQVKFPQKVPYIGLDSAHVFLDYVCGLARKMTDKFVSKSKGYTMSAEDWESYFHSPTSGICTKPLIRRIEHACCDPTAGTCALCAYNAAEASDRVVIDHCHLQGIYRWPAHDSCNKLYS